MDQSGTKRMWDHLEWWKTVEWFAVQADVPTHRCVQKKDLCR